MFTLTTERSLFLLAGACLLAMLLLAPASELAAFQKAAPKSRTFLFTYQTTIMGLPPDKTARIWLPVPPTTDEQQVKIEAKDVPEGAKISREPRYGNEILYVEAKPTAAGSVSLSMTYHVTRKEVKGETPLRTGDEKLLKRVLQPDAKVPIDGKPLTLLDGKKVPKDQFAAAKMLYDLVNNHMTYSKKGVGWGLGDSNWACDARYGNCSDFHSLFISLARAQKIPAKFEMGFPLPEKRGEGEIGGYHCWAKFKPEGKGWVPVDISEANKEPKMTEYYFGNLTEDRVAFTTGRDIDLAPQQDTGELNFFIYPHVEVDKKLWPAEKVQRKFSFKDVK
jgi:transglutaminase-like putative cysteine protease